MKSILALLLTVLTGTAYAQDTLDLTEIVTASKREEIPSREQIFKDVSNKVAREYVRQILGDSKFERSQKTLVTRIYPRADRYIPVMRNSNFEPGPDGKLTSTITMKLSIKDLREMLLKEGLLSTNEGTPTVVTFISISDRVNAKSHRWWLPDPVSGGGSLLEYSQKSLKLMKDEFNDRGFFVADPQTRDLKDLIPPIFLNDSYKTEDLSFLGEYLGYEIVVSGKIVFSRSLDNPNSYGINVDIQAIQSANGQSIAEVVRNFEIKGGGAFEWAITNNFSNVIAEASKELASQVQEVWQKGTLGSDLLRMVLSGDVEYKELESFKMEASRLPEVKLLRERLFERGSITFDVGSSVSPAILADKLKASKLSQNYLFSTSGSQVSVKKK
jgi:hypothetical protein